jgi:hypothetical protein
MKLKQNEHIFATNDALSWETWHHRYGHMGYTGLQRIYDQNLVEGFDVNTQTPKPNCIAYTEGKLAVKPYD